MKNTCTIVMYHYVRNISRSRYSGIKGLEVCEFESQIRYLLENFHIISADTLVECLFEGKCLPEKSALLTFDDGYIDHYLNVFPILMKYNLPGCFYPPSQAILEHKLLDVNKIQLILSQQGSSNLEILEDMKRLLNRYKNEYNLMDFNYYYDRLCKKGHYDIGDIMFVKLMLQNELSVDVRAIFIDELYDKYIGVDEGVVARETYASLENLKLMCRLGMHIGSHGFSHSWLSSLKKPEQLSEIQSSIEFLDEIYMNPDSSTKGYSICYPSGMYNEETLGLVEDMGFSFGLSTFFGLADVSIEGRFELKRQDTNEIAKLQTSKVLSTEVLL